MLPLLEKAINAHGGLDRWNQIEKLVVELRIGGNILAMKWRSPHTRQLKATIDPKKMYCRLAPFPKQGYVGIWEGNQVYIEKDGELVVEKTISRKNNGKVEGASLVWDDLDLLYFLGYALWNYSVTPFVFLNPGFECKELITNRDQKLIVKYPSSIPTHCQEQVFYFNQSHYLCRLDYTAEVFSKMAQGAHYCQQHKSYQGIVFPSKRVVYPRLPSGHIIKFFKVMEGFIDNVSIVDF